MEDIYSIQRNECNQIIWKPHQKEKIIELYQEGKSLVEICNLFGISAPDTVRRILKANGILVIGFRNKYPVNETYFSKIDSNDKAYWLGLLYADGAIYKNSIRLNLKDREHIQKFKEAIGAINHKIGKVVDTRFSTPCDIYYVSIKSTLMKEDLAKLGCTNQKSLTIKTIPNIDDKFISHFIRGYFDGDGSLHSTFINQKKQYRISFVGTYELLLEIQNYLQVKEKIRQNGGQDNKSYVFQINGHKQIKRIMDWLLKDAKQNEVLDRKYNKYLEMCDYLGASPLNLEI